MTVSFYKLQTAGNDFVLVDLSRPSHAAFPTETAALGEFAAAVLDRRSGVGGRGCIFVGGATAKPAARPTTKLSAQDRLAARVFRSDGVEDHVRNDALLCVARWAFDSGKTGAGKIRLDLPRGERILTTVDSRSFSMELPPPRAYGIDEEPPSSGPLGPDDGSSARLNLIVDGRPATAYLLSFDTAYAVALASKDGPGMKRVRTALAAAAPEATAVIARSVGGDLVRFVATESADRVSSAAAAVAATVLANGTGGEYAAEWRGRGGAVSYADFGAANSAGTPLSARQVPAPGDGPAALVDRGRFWVEWNRSGRILVVGMAEYAFEGSFDYTITSGS